jgi:hypothetical protein
VHQQDISITIIYTHVFARDELVQQQQDIHVSKLKHHQTDTADHSL